MNGAKTFFVRMSLCAACACTATLYRLVQRGSALRSPTLRYPLTLLTSCGGFDVPSMIRGTMQRPIRGICLRHFQFGWSIHILPTCRSLARCRVCQNTFNIIFFLFNTIRRVIVSVSQSLAHQALKELFVVLIVVQEKFQYSRNITTNRHETQGGQ